MYLYVISYNSINKYLCRYKVILCVACKADVERVVIMAKRNLFEELREGIEEIKSNRLNKSQVEYLALKRLKNPEKCWTLAELEQGLDLES